MSGKEGENDKEITKKKTAAKSKTAKEPELTVKETIFIKEFVKNGGNKTRAALKAYNTDDYQMAAVIGYKNLMKPRIRNIVEEELERQGITLELAIKPVAKALVATKEVEGETVDDLELQLKGHDRAAKLMGLNERQDANNYNFHIDKAAFGGEFVDNG